MYENTEFTLSRDCEAIQIPSGQKTTIPAGTQGVITQSLGGSYTIATYQGLARIAENDLDALGLEKPQAQPTQKPARSTNGEVSEEDVWNQLRQCYDPEIPVDIYELGLIYDVDISEDGDATITMTLTTPHCPVAESLPQEVELRTMSVPGIRDAVVNLVWDPPWDPSKMSDEARLELGML